MRAKVFMKLQYCNILLFQDLSFYPNSYQDYFGTT